MGHISPVSARLESRVRARCLAVSHSLSVPGRSSRGQGSDPTEWWPGRGEAQAQPLACWGRREESGNFYICFLLSSQLAGINLIDQQQPRTLALSVRETTKERRTGFGYVKKMTLERGKTGKQISLTINQFERQMTTWKNTVAAYLTHKGLNNLNMQKVCMNQ